MAADSEQRFVQQLKKGVLEMLVLQLLTHQPCHGYELIVRLRDAGSGLLDLKEGTLYPILYRLEEEGAISSAWSSPEPGIRPGKVPRRIYTVTHGGRRCWNKKPNFGTHLPPAWTRHWRGINHEMENWQQNGGHIAAGKTVHERH